MSRHATVVTVVGHRPLGTQGLHWPVTTTATVAWAECRCGATLTTVVRPDETTGDVVDALLRAADWDPAHDMCPDCRDEEHMCPRPADACPVCTRRCQ